MVQIMGKMQEESSGTGWCIDAGSFIVVFEQQCAVVCFSASGM
jgi:hypothetical protein